jgi:hypothetical protein
VYAEGLPRGDATTMVELVMGATIMELRVEVVQGTVVV